MSWAARRRAAHFCGNGVVAAAAHLQRLAGSSSAVDSCYALDLALPAIHCELDTASSSPLPSAQWWVSCGRYEWEYVAGVEELESADGTQGGSAGMGGCPYYEPTFLLLVSAVLAGYGLYGRVALRKCLLDGLYVRWSVASSCVVRSKVCLDLMKMQDVFRCVWMEKKVQSAEKMFQAFWIEGDCNAH